MYEGRIVLTGELLRLYCFAGMSLSAIEKIHPTKEEFVSHLRECGDCRRRVAKKIARLKGVFWATEFVSEVRGYDRGISIGAHTEGNLIVVHNWGRR